MKTAFTRLFALTVVAGLAASACGDDDATSSSDSASAPPSTTVAGTAPSAATVTSASTAAGEPVTIVFESYNYGTQGLGGEGTQQLIDEFEASHPNITVEPVGTPVADIHTDVQAKVAAGSPPDVAQIGWSKFAFVLENLPYVPIDELTTAQEFQAHTAGIYPAALAMGERDGRFVGLPYTISTPTMMINTALFEAAGLDPEHPPATWAEAEEAALKIVDTGAQGIYVDAATESKSDFLTQTLINSNGGRVLTDDGSVAFDSPEAIEALAMLGDLTSSGAQPAVSESEAIALFEAGQLGILITSTAALAGLVASTDGVFEIETAGIPAFDGHPVGPTVSGAGLFVFSQDPAKRAAAWELVKFLTGEQGYTIITSKIGYLPLRPEIIDDPQFLGPYFASDDRLRPAMAQLEALVPYQVFPGPDGTRATQMLQDNAVAPIMLSGADPAETLAEVAEQVRALLGE